MGIFHHCGEGLLIDPTERLRLCRDAVALDPESAVAHLALASACRETQDTLGAREALEVGTFTGYSAICIARGLRDGGRLTCRARR